jgi:hypothetical protein
MPLAPMGCEAQVHEKTNKGSTWAYHWLTAGISSHCQNIAHTIVTSSTPRATDYLTQSSNFNTNASPIPPSRMPTK